MPSIDTEYNNHLRLAYRLLMILILVGPLLWGINQPVTMTFIQLVSLPLIWIAFQQRHQLMRSHASIVVFLLLMIGFLLMQLVPLPMAIWQDLPGRQSYVEVLQFIPAEMNKQWRAATIVPASTEKAMLYLLVPVSVFLTALLLDKTLLTRLCLAMLAIAVIQSVLGLIQYGGGIELSGNNLYAGSARGTYLNRDHLANLLAMIFPVVLAMLASMLGIRLHRRNHSASHRHNWRFLATLEGNQSLIYAAIAILIILCLVFTRSRAGIALVMVGLLLSLFAFSSRLGRSNVYGAYGTVVAVITVLALEIGLAPILDRFSVDPMQDLRWEIYAITLQAMGDFFPVGSGMGTFSAIYAAYQTPNLDGFINHAHNDYLQWLLEGGLPVLLLLLYALYRFVIHWRYVWVRHEWGGFRFIQVGAGIGVFLVILHSFLDFSLHKPANAIYFAFLLALFFHSNHQGRLHRRSLSD